MAFFFFFFFFLRGMMFASSIDSAFLFLNLIAFFFFLLLILACMYGVLGSWINRCVALKEARCRVACTCFGRDFLDLRTRQTARRLSRTESGTVRMFDLQTFLISSSLFVFLSHTLF